MSESLSSIKMYGDQYFDCGSPHFSDALSNVKLLLLGDSITQGAGGECSDGIDFTTSLGTKKIWQQGQSWALQLRDYLAVQYPNITFLNHGWGGITLGKLANRMSEFVPDDTTHCIVGLGVNSGGATSFDSEIATIINYLRNRGIKIFAWTSWIGTHQDIQNINTPGRIQAALVHAYNAVGIQPLHTYSIIRRYLDEENIPDSEVMQTDSYVHPNVLGHTILYRVIREGFGF